MAESTVNRYDIKAPCLQFIKISKSTLDIKQFFWKGIGMQYLSGQVERKGKGKVLWRIFSFPFFPSMTIIFSKKKSSSGLETAWKCFLLQYLIPRALGFRIKWGITYPLKDNKQGFPNKHLGHLCWNVKILEEFGKIFESFFWILEMERN